MKKKIEVNNIFNIIEIALKEYEERKKGSEPHPFFTELKEDLGEKGLCNTDTFQKYKDVIVKVINTETKEEKSFDAIKYCLASYSKYFYHILNQDNSQDINEIIVKDIDPFVFQQILYYLHYGNIELSPENVFDLVFTSDYLGIKQLFDDTIKYYINNFSPYNISDFYYITTKITGSPYKENVDKYIISNNQMLLLKCILFYLANIIYLSFEILEKLLNIKESNKYLSEYEIAFVLLFLLQGLYSWYIDNKFYDTTDEKENNQLKEGFKKLLHYISWENVSECFINKYIKTPNLEKDIGIEIINEICSINSGTHIDKYVVRDSGVYYCIIILFQIIY